MAKPLLDGETPGKQFELIMEKLEQNKNFQFANSIAKGMIDVINKNMRSRRGILAMITIREDTGCADEVSINNRVGDDVTVSGGWRNCVKKKKSKVAGQSVELDANRIGWSGSPNIFARMSVKTLTFINALKKGLKDLPLNTKEDALGKDKVKVDASVLWKGVCLDSQGDKAESCTALQTAACKAKAGCAWSGPWDGSLSTESDVAYGA